MFDSTHLTNHVNNTLDSTDEITIPAYLKLTQLQRDMLFYLRHYSRKFNNFITISVQHLMDRFNRGDTVIRDALRALKAEGLIKRDSHRGKGHTALTMLTDAAFQVMDILTGSKGKISLVTQPDGQTDGQNHPYYSDQGERKKDDHKDDLVTMLAKKEGLDEAQTEEVRKLHAKADHTKIHTPIAFVKSLIKKMREGIAEMLKTPEQRAQKEKLEAELKAKVEVRADEHMSKIWPNKPSFDANNHRWLEELAKWDVIRGDFVFAELKKERLAHGLIKDEKPVKHNPRNCDQPKKATGYYRKDWQSDYE